MNWPHRQTKKTLKVDSLDLGENVTILNLPSLDKMAELRASNESIIETDRDYFLIHSDLAYKVLKKEAMPEILKTKSLSFNPDHCSAKVQLDVKDLLAFALNNNILVFETQDEYIIPSEMVLTAKKELKLK